MMCIVVAVVEFTVFFAAALTTKGYLGGRTVTTVHAMEETFWVFNNSAPMKVW